VNPKKTDRDDTDLSNAVFCENLARRSNSLDGIAAGGVVTNFEVWSLTEL
jgi:hypothetical protein